MRRAEMLLDRLASGGETKRYKPLPRRLHLPSRMPVNPGRFLETRFLKPLRLSQSDLAEALGVSRRRINELIRGHRAITADTAVRLALYFGNDAAFWLGLQTAWDVHVVLRNFGSHTSNEAP
jgi:addiction module HigA family antidote